MYLHYLSKVVLLHVRLPYDSTNTPDCVFEYVLIMTCFATINHLSGQIRGHVVSLGLMMIHRGVWGCSLLLEAIFEA